MNISLITFAGVGSRIHSSIPKQFIKIKDKEIVAYTIDAFEEHPLIDEIVLITHKDYYSYVKNMVFKYGYKKVTHIVNGGNTRQESVRLGLSSIKCDDNDHILIHDGDRPLISNYLITRLIRELEHSKIVAPVIKKAKEDKNTSGAGRVIIIDNEEYNVETPECFFYQDIKDAHNRLKDIEVSDDASLFDEKQVKYIEGEAINFKVTTDQDLEYLKKIIENHEENN